MFSQIESQFLIAGISQEETKFHHVVAILEEDILSYVSDLVRCKRNDNPYTQLKNRLITQLADSESVRLRNLLSDMQLGADFLERYGLLVDIKNGKLIDVERHRTTRGHLFFGLSLGITVLSGDTQYHKILSKFPNLTNTSLNIVPKSHGTSYLLKDR
ncbi:hypothetical protein AVEN_24206-1 [Araneus ventricosus]|uniref:DUF7041 domain-containing protein n=1 Tax=Araneus ventricosus TaxID=182803 RepID=A0A4Y2GTX0_ARAVE|nr:hypothetical protein AVEN_24206-1 [Araneus ventricosus]